MTVLDQMSAKKEAHLHDHTIGTLRKGMLSTDMGLSKKEIITLAFFAIVIGFMTGLGIGHYKNIRYELMMNTLNSTHNDLKNYESQAKALSSMLEQLNGNSATNVSKVLEKGLIEIGCSRNLNRPSPLSPGFTKPPQVMLFGSRIGFNVRSDTDYLLDMPGHTSYIFDNDLVILPEGNSTFRSDFEVCWMAHANTTLTPPKP